MKKLLPLALLLGAVPMMVSSSETPTAKRDIPKADASAPKKIKTATFAVG